MTPQAHEASQPQASQQQFEFISGHLTDPERGTKAQLKARDAAIALDGLRMAADQLDEDWATGVWKPDIPNADEPSAQPISSSQEQVFSMPTEKLSQAEKQAARIEATIEQIQHAAKFKTEEGFWKWWRNSPNVAFMARYAAAGNARAAQIYENPLSVVVDDSALEKLRLWGLRTYEDNEREGERDARSRQLNRD